MIARRPIVPLTADQQDLAARHVDLARKVAARMTAKLPRFRDEAESAAMVGLCEAAARFDPRRGLEFTTLAFPRIRGAILDEMRNAVLAGFRRHPGDPPKVESLDVIRCETAIGEPVNGHYFLPSDDEPIEAITESVDEIDRLLRGLPDGYREPMFLLYTRADRATMKAAGRAVGLCESRISKIHAASIAMIRRNLGLADPPRAEVPTKDRGGMILDHDGETLTIKAWGRRTGLPAKVIRQRLWDGWTVESALTAPRRRYIRRPATNGRGATVAPASRIPRTTSERGTRP